ncbi:MAG: ABC transporter permease [Candidatus Methanofastidiosa archaeon]|nr:ABC transporter permease [Candidatus Methanofastidiosa archaeon]
MGNVLTKIFKSSKVPITLLLIGIIIFFSLLSDAFLSTENFLNIFRQISMTGIAGVGMICVMLTGGIDLSISSMVTLVNICCAYMMVKWGMNPVLAGLLMIMVTTLLGTLNGVLVSYGRLIPLISTLCMQNILKGLSYIISKGQPIFGFPKSFKILGQGYVGIIPIPVIIMIVIAIIGHIFLSKTYIGRYFYCIGGNEEATRLSGVDTKKIKCLSYTVCGFFSGLAGIVWLSRVNSGQPVTGSGFEFDVISGIVLGGVSVLGGEGDVLGAILGVIVIGILNNGLILVNVGEYYQLLVKGVVLLLAIGMDSFKRNYRRKPGRA